MGLIARNAIAIKWGRKTECTFFRLLKSQLPCKQCTAQWVSVRTIWQQRWRSSCNTAPFIAPVSCVPAPDTGTFSNQCSPVRPPRMRSTSTSDYYRHLLPRADSPLVEHTELLHRIDVVTFCLFLNIQKQNKIVKLRERERQRVDLGRSLKGHL